ncbi:MAG: transposase [Limnochordia bacterium]|jgi:transposase-like protein|nr:transposase [Limnochordia bacterium]
MKSRQYSDEFKEKIIQECQEVGNVSLVARRYEISPNTIHTWLRKYRELGTVRSLKRGELANVKAMSEQLKKVSTENDRLKRLVAEKELEIAILRDLLNTVNPK